MSERLPVNPASTAENRSSVAEGIGLEVRAARVLLGISMRELAKRIGTSQPFVSNIENGRIFPSLRTLGLLATALDVPVGKLLPSTSRVERITASQIGRARARSEGPVRPLLTVGELRAVRIEIAPGEVERRPVMHEGEEFVILLAGVLILLREGLPPLRMESGDTLWLDGTVPHRFACPDESPVPGSAFIALVGHDALDSHS
ncbi:helix-turn-helix domain-containing protein [Agreia pratensis]|uniref:Transcriptional regulator, XRE family with cupin sensor n=1 Tax=Agreia pratensis TaxID=150121 RepID=A0A1X7I985_9MICO|nr:XRE family transcriptional regulator [Agreia pratensis]SMG11153.1 transcriptional regulator, XRE family with cupin sensor [Agreia pratensis]